MSGKLVALTGGAGSFGACLVAALQTRGHRVRGLEHRREVRGVDERVRGDLRDPAAAAALVAGVEAVVHAAAVTHARRQRRYRDVNVGGTMVLLEAAAAARVARFVHVSTHALDSSGGAYSRSKADAERLVTSAAIEAVVVRLPEVIGGDGREGIDGLIDAARAGRPILVVGRGDHELRPAHADDVAAAIAAAVDARDAGGKTYTLGAAPVTLRGMAETLRDSCGGRSRIVSVPEPLVALLCRASRLLPLPVYPDQLDRLRAERPAPSTDAETDLGFRPRALVDAVCGPRDRAP